MKKFITIPMVTYKEGDPIMGDPEERRQVIAKIDADKVIGYREAIPDGEDEAAIVVFCTGDFSFYSPISMKEFEKLLNPKPEDYGMTEMRLTGNKAGLR